MRTEAQRHPGALAQCAIVERTLQRSKLHNTENSIFTHICRIC